jgi:hypothetical protein
VAPVRAVLFSRSNVCVLCGVHRRPDLISRSNRVAALRRQIHQSGNLGLHLGLSPPHRRRHLVLAGSIWLCIGIVSRRGGNEQMFGANKQTPRGGRSD